jgi:4'-phosphopantetheinyl transferase
MVSSSVDVWTIDPAAARDPDLRARYASMLSADETAQLGRYRVERARHQFLVARALVRTVLAERLRIEPASVPLRVTSAGRPELDSPQRLDFNVSHTDGLIVLAVTQGTPVGVDVETRDRNVDPIKLSRRFFTPDEHAAILAADDDRRRERFITLWTLKEAFLKARGAGLTEPLHSIGLSLDADGSVQVQSAPPGEADAWRFITWQPTQRHHAAVAVRAGSRGDVTLRVRRAPT